MTDCTAIFCVWLVALAQQGSYPRLRGDDNSFFVCHASLSRPHTCRHTGARAPRNLSIPWVVPGRYLLPRRDIFTTTPSTACPPLRLAKGNSSRDRNILSSPPTGPAKSSDFVGGSMEEYPKGEVVFLFETCTTLCALKTTPSWRTPLHRRGT